MNFTLDDIENIISSALEKLYYYDQEILDRRLKEETINHRLAIYIEEGFKENPKTIDFVFSVDVEFNRMDGDEKKSIIIDGKFKNIRPDIIVHQRELMMGKNILAIECKMNKFSPYDLKKLEALQDSGLDYQYGVLMNYAIDKNYFHFKILKGTAILLERKIQKQIK